MEPTHIPKTVIVNGKRKTVFARTAATDEKMERDRLGTLADLESLTAAAVIEFLHHKIAVIQADYMTARRMIRTRLGLDRGPHRIFNGALLVGEYFHNNEAFRSGFPYLKQVYIPFGYIENGNRSLHQVLCEAMFLRYETGLHAWLLIPRSLDEMKAIWGEAFENFRMFPFLSLPPDTKAVGPVSTASPLQPNPPIGVVTGKWHTDGGYTPEDPGELKPEPLIQGDAKFAPVEKKKKRWS